MILKNFSSSRRVLCFHQLWRVLGFNWNSEILVSPRCIRVVCLYLELKDFGVCIRAKLTKCLQKLKCVFVAHAFKWSRIRDGQSAVYFSCYYCEFLLKSPVITKSDRLNLQNVSFRLRILSQIIAKSSYVGIPLWWPGLWSFHNLAIGETLDAMDIGTLVFLRKMVIE